MASIADRMSSLGSSGKKSISGAMGHESHQPSEHGGGEQTIITHHADGKHSVHHSDGEESGPHEHLHEALAHISAKHHPDEPSSHVMHGEDGGHTSHHSKGGEVSGPHDHENLEALKSHMGKFLDEEGHEGSYQGGHDDGMWG